MIIPHLVGVAIDVAFYSGQLRVWITQCVKDKYSSTLNV